MRNQLYTADARPTQMALNLAHLPFDNLATAFIGGGIVLFCRWKREIETVGVKFGKGAEASSPGDRGEQLPVGQEMPL